QRVADVGREMEKIPPFAVPGGVGFHNARKDFFRGLHQTLGPTGLLRFEAVHIDGQFGSAFDLREIEEFPTFELRPIGKVGVLGKSVVLPAAGFFDGSTAPDACRAVEVEKGAAAGARTVLDDEVAVEKNGFDLRQERVVAVEVGPAGLYHADLRTVGGIDEIRDRAAEEIGLGDKIRVEDGDEFAARSLEAVFERSGFVAFAIGAVDVNDRHALRSVAFHASAGNLASFVGGIVKDLNVEQFARVVEAGNGFDEALDHVALVEDRKLDGDTGPILDLGRRAGNILRVDVIIVDEPIAVQAVSGQDEQDKEVGDHHGKVEGIGVIDA